MGDRRTDRNRLDYRYGYGGDNVDVRLGGGAGGGISNARDLQNHPAHRAVDGNRDVNGGIRGTAKWTVLCSPGQINMDR